MIYYTICSYKAYDKVLFLNYYQMIRESVILQINYQITKDQNLDNLYLHKQKKINISIIYTKDYLIKYLWHFT